MDAVRRLTLIILRDPWSMSADGDGFDTAGPTLCRHRSMLPLEPPFQDVPSAFGSQRFRGLRERLAMRL